MARPLALTGPDSCCLGNDRLLPSERSPDYRWIAGFTICERAASGIKIAH